MGRKKQVNNGNIEIDTSLSIFNAALIHEKITEAYKKYDRIEIDLKEITDCDTAGIQLLYSLKKSCIEAGKEISRTCQAGNCAGKKSKDTGTNHRPKRRASRGSNLGCQWKRD